MSNKLNPEQQAAVMHVDGPLVVLAGAGSGKTRVITQRIAQLLRDGHAKPSQILALTFTNKAANEMRDRVSGIIGKDAADKVFLGTFHSFCLRVLRREIERIGYRKNFSVSSESDVRTILRRVLDDMDGVKDAFSPKIFLERIGTIKNSGDSSEGPEQEEEKDSDTETEAKYRKWMPAIYEKYQSALRAANTLDFDDLLVKTVELWRKHPEVLTRYQNRFRYILVDEYQDTNAVQYRLIRALAGERANLFVVGDDDQSIYGWRGADIRNILDFESDYPSAKIVKLEQNYRSTQTILNAANAVIGRNKQRRPKKLWSALGEGRAIDHIVTADSESEADTSVEWLQHILQKSGGSFGDFAVLYRSNIQSRSFEIAFRRAGIPYVVRGGQDFFDRAEVRDILAYLRVIANPADEAAVLRVVNVPRRGVGDAALHHIHDVCREESVSFAKAMRLARDRGTLSTRAAQGIGEFLDLTSMYRSQFESGSRAIPDLVQGLIEASGYKAELRRLAKTPGQWIQRSENLDAVTMAAEQYCESTRKPTLTEFLDQCSLEPPDNPRRTDNRDERSATLMTIHSAKGLEFPFVFIAGVEEGLMPHDKNVLGPGLEEERRLFYVALTRARRHVTLFEAIERDRHGRPRPTTTSRFLAELPEGSVNIRHRATRPEPEPNSGKSSKKKRTA
jgi:superfamily I DNA/RNA helicase